MDDDFLCLWSAILRSFMWHERKKKCDHLQHNLLCISWEARFVNRLSETFIFQHSQFHESSINNHGNDKIIKL